MEGKAIIKNIGKSAKKMRIPSEVVRGMNVYTALNVLKFMNKGTAIHVYKGLKSATANAVSKGATLNDLYIKEIRIDKGAVRVRHGHPKARGAGYFIWERGTSNLIVVVSDDRVAEVKADSVKEDAKSESEKSETKAKKPATKGKSSSK